GFAGRCCSPFSRRSHCAAGVPRCAHRAPANPLARSPQAHSSRPSQFSCVLRLFLTLRNPSQAVKTGKPVPEAGKGRQHCSWRWPRSNAAGYNSPVSSLASSNVRPSIRVKVLLFGRLKEVAGGAEEFVELPPGSRIEDIFTHLISRCPELARFRSSLVASRNQ